MKAILSALSAYLRQSLATMLQYRGEIVLWAVWGVVYPAVAMAMWSAAIKGTGGHETIEGFGPRDFAAYFLLTMIVGHACTAWDIYDMGYLVRSGHMSAKLLRPLLPVWERVADNLAYKILTLTILVPIWIGVAFVTHPEFDTNTTDLLYGVPAVFLAAALSFLWCYILGLFAFWLTRMDAIGEFWFGASLFFGGRLAPLEIMPHPLQKVASALPFKWMIWFPSSALTGKLKPTYMAGAIINQLAWLALGIAVFIVLWKISVKRYSAVGA